MSKTICIVAESGRPCDVCGQESNGENIIWSSKLQLSYCLNDKTCKERIKKGLGPDQYYLAKLYVARGDARFFEGKFDQAISWYEKALKIVSDMDAPKENLKIATSIQEREKNKVAICKIKTLKGEKTVFFIPTSGTEENIVKLGENYQQYYISRFMGIPDDESFCIDMDVIDKNKSEYVSVEDIKRIKDFIREKNDHV